MYVGLLSSPHRPWSPWSDFRADCSLVVVIANPLARGADLPSLSCRQYTHGGDNFNFNGTLFGFMTTTCNKVYDRACMAKYRQDRWHQSQQENEKCVPGLPQLCRARSHGSLTFALLFSSFFFGPGELFLGLG